MNRYGIVHFIAVIGLQIVQIICYDISKCKVLKVLHFLVILLLYLQLIEDWNWLVVKEYEGMG
jgi:hypothetical protein